MISTSSIRTNFYPRPPRGGRHVSAAAGNALILFLSTPSARRATYRQHGRRSSGAISIHALREEGDVRALTPKGGDGTFLSTPSARRATSRGTACRRGKTYFYPRPPRGGRPAASFGCSPSLISIHALREEGDQLWGRRTRPLRDFYPRPPRGGRQPSVTASQSHLDFYPRPPRGGRPAQLARASAAEAISIHALREEGDVQRGRHYYPVQHFYPRPPRGGRRLDGGNGFHDFLISIHALREEGDGTFHGASRNTPYFYPRPPRGGRPGDIFPDHVSWSFLSTPSARRATSTPARRRSWLIYFYPRPPRGGRR